MHPAPSFLESFRKPSKSEDRPQQHVSHHRDHLEDPQRAGRAGPAEPLSLEHAVTSPSQASTPVRKNTASSTSTNASEQTVVTATSSDTNATAFSVESSQSIFSVKDGSEILSNRRASRRRTGPLSAQQREKAALIRKLGACGDCRRRRVACHPNHHNMSWEDAVRKYRSASPLGDFAPIAGRPISPALHHVRSSLGHDPHEMDVDIVPATPQAPPITPTRPALSEARIRTPLPSGPRIEKPISVPPLATTPSTHAIFPRLNSVKADLESTASRILSSPHRYRYSSVYVLLVFWQDDDESGVVRAMEELDEVLHKNYHFACEVIRIPPNASDGCPSSGRWLSRAINEFMDKSDTRDVLKIVYYNGYSCLDEDREMLLASSRDREGSSKIRWSGIQQILEEACSDTLIIMDSAYYPSSKMVRQKGVLELIAASASEDYFDLLERSSFTRALAEQLRTRSAQRSSNSNALSAAELHSRLLSLYPKIIHSSRSTRLDRDAVAGNSAARPSYPAPLHMQMSGNARLPSITLSPPQLPPTLPSPPTSSTTHAGPHLTLSIRLTDESSISLENWAEWFCMMPEGIRDVKVEGPYYTFR
ncbi:hypothetical protein F5Y15DRAFT_409735 [Xylariaceae sp. FL0016]|nr:hypothetical protein F5Y15DRAFT_409735 [Xylariaceae sp. FL0016]